jgi:hypothetical protein
MDKSNQKNICFISIGTFIRLLVILLSLAIIGVFNLVSAANWYVSTVGSDSNLGTDWDNAFATIQHGIVVAGNGDTVIVADGTYTGDGNKNILLEDEEIEVRSINGPNSCIIDLENDGKGFYLYFAPAASVIDGFTIMNGKPTDSLDYGVGIKCSYCSTTLRNCIIKNNSGVQWGAGIDIRGSTANPVIMNTIFQGNNSGGGSAVSVYQASATFINCTFIGNTSSQSVIAGTSYTSIIDSIVWNNYPGSIDSIVTHSNVEGGYPGDGNIDSTPLFLNTPNLWDRTTAEGTTTTVEVSDAGLYSVGDVIEIDDDEVVRTVNFASGNIVAFTPALLSASTSDVLIENWGTGAIDLNEDFHLYPSSQCIDAGYNLVTGISERDLDGKPRFIDGDNDMDATVDMGTYEYGDIGECDFNEDLDVDGADLVEFINDSHGYTLTAFVEDFGRADCPYYIK